MVPFKYASAFTRANIKVGIRTLCQDLQPPIPIKIRRPVFITVFIAIQNAVSAFLGVNQVRIGNRPDIREIDSAKYAVPVRAIALRLPQIVHPATFSIDFMRLIDFLVYQQHFFMHAVDLGVFDHEITPVAAIEIAQYIKPVFIRQVVL